MLVLYAALEQVESRMEQLPLLMSTLRFYEFLLLNFLIIRNDIVNPEYNVTNVLNPTFTVPQFLLRISTTT